MLSSALVWRTDQARLLDRPARRQIDPDALKAAITKALSADLGDLDRIKELPGFPRAAAATLSKGWAAGLDLAHLAATAQLEAAPRLAAVARLEEEVLRRLPLSMCRPADLISAALARAPYGRVLFGRIAVLGRTEMSPVWRPLLAALAAETDVQWIAGPRHVPPWVHELGIPVVEAPRENPEIRTESCASPRHEALEALRWARELIASTRAQPEEIAIAAASPEEWDDHFLALGAMSGLDLHFVHGRKVLTTPDGQLAAAIADVLLRGLSHTRMVRLVSLLRRYGKLLTGLPPDWAQALAARPAQDAPLFRTRRGLRSHRRHRFQSVSDGDTGIFSCWFASIAQFGSHMTPRWRRQSRANPSLK